MDSLRQSEQHPEPASSGRQAGNDPAAGRAQRNERKAERHEWSTFVQVAWLSAHDLGEPMFLETVDLSAGGIGLLTRSMVHLGTVGIVLLVDNAANYQVRCFEVKHCHYDTWMARHVVGGQWVEQPHNMHPVDVKMTDRGYRMVRGRGRTEKFRRKPDR